MDVLIVEDEIHTAKRLAKMLQAIDEEIVVHKIIDSVEETIELLSERPKIDLIFMDNQLSDGISFEIFAEIDVDYPVVFTTSYDEYAIKAFEVNSVDYLLKPIEEDALRKSIEKFKRLFSINYQRLQIEQMLTQTELFQKVYKTRILVKTPKSLITIQVADIAYFYIDTQLVFAKLFDGSSYTVDKSLDELESSLDPKLFFRLNRQFIASINSINNIHNYFNNTLKIELKPANTREIIVSRYNIKEFKKWLDM